MEERTLGLKAQKLKVINEEQNKMDIFESLENLNVSEECFNDIVGIVEEYIQEKSDWTVTRVKQAARRSKKGRFNDLEQGDQDPSSPEAQYNLGRARRVASILELPNSNKPFKEVQKAADNSLQGRKTTKERHDKETTEYIDTPVCGISGLLNPDSRDRKCLKQIKNDSKRYLKSVGLSSKKGFTNPINNAPLTDGDNMRDYSKDKGGKVYTSSEPDYEYQNRYYHS